MKIYTVLEHIYTDNWINVFNYSNLEKAKDWLKDLIEYYKENYSELFNDKSHYSISDDYFYLWNDDYDLVVIELFENELDK
jgi:intein-encoded DNA endonuclease-like protein